MLTSVPEMLVKKVKIRLFLKKKKNKRFTFKKLNIQLFDISNTIFLYWLF